MAEVRETELPRGAAALNWRKRMSDTIAHALLGYTALQIILTARVLQEGAHAALLLVGLVALVAGVIPGCRALEARWSRLDDVGAADPALAPAYRKARRMIWALAIGLPFVLTGGFKLVSAALAA